MLSNVFSIIILLVFLEILFFQNDFLKQMLFQDEICIIRISTI